jgi:Fic family protein
MKPPYTITTHSINLVAQVMLHIGRLEGLSFNSKSSPELRRQNRIKTIYSTLAIEGNTLSLEQVSAMIEEKRVLGPQKDILEVTNAIQLYNQLNSFNPLRVESFLRAHHILMNGLVNDAGHFRRRGVGIQKGKDIIHIAPPAENVPSLIHQLFKYISVNKDHALIQSCVLHYELEFIHPFSDGNGRMGRFWQTLKLCELSSLFENLPIESLIKQRQEDYYRVLSQCDKEGQSSLFIEFILEIILESLKEYESNNSPQALDCEDRLAKASETFPEKTFARKDYLELFPNLSTATASRDLKSGVIKGVLKIIGQGRMSRYQFT